jgi:hypothetical protein
LINYLLDTWWWGNIGHPVSQRHNFYQRVLWTDKLGGNTSTFGCGRCNLDRVLTFESALPLHNIGTGNNNLKQKNNIRNGSKKGPQKSPPKTSQKVWNFKIYFPSRLYSRFRSFTKYKDAVHDLTNWSNLWRKEFWRS